MTVTRRDVIKAAVVGGAAVSAANVWAARKARADEEAPPPSDVIKAQVIIFDGFQLTDGLAPYDVLNASGLVGAKFEPSTATLDGAPQVVTYDGMIVQPTAAFDPQADVLIVPGGPDLWRAGQAPDGLYEVLRAYHATGKLLTSVCTGAIFLGRAELLGGRNATTHRAGFDALVETGANLVQARVVDDGDIVTAAGVTSGIDLAIYLVERFFGPQLAFSTERAVEHERRGVVWRR